MKFKSRSIPLFLGLLFIVVLGSWYVLDHESAAQFSNSDRYDALQKLLQRDPVLKITPLDTGWDTFKGKYISLRYPHTSRLYQPSANPTILEAFSFQDIASRALVTVQVTSIPGAQNIAEYPAYHSRDSDKQIYLGEKYSHGSLSGMLFRKNDSPHELAAFFEQDDRVISIIVTGTDMQEMEKLFRRLMSSIVIYPKKNGP